MSKGMRAKHALINLDAAATTSVDPRVIERMVTHLLDSDANPSAHQHALGRQAAALVAEARADIAAEFRCDADEVVFTAGATEANNLALRGLALAHAKRGRHLIVSAMEHRSVLACAESLASEGFELSRLQPDASGRVDPAELRAALRPDTLLVSIQHINNETGAIQPLDEVAAIAADAGVLLHVDAAQSAGKFPIRLDALPIDLLAVSAHKFHGPKGSGCLIVRNRRRLRLRPIMQGGGQEFGLRPGTLATHQILGLSTALQLAAEQRRSALEHVAELRGRFLERLQAHLPQLRIHGDPAHSSPYILSFSIPGIVNSALMNQLADGVALGSGAACSAGTIDPSPTLRAMGLDDEALHGAVRASFARTHQADEIDEAADRIIAAVSRLRKLAC